MIVADATALTSQLVLAGFFNVKEDAAAKQVTAQKPAQTKVSSAPLKLNLESKSSASQQQQPAGVSVWSAGNLADEDDLVDEDALLSKDQVKVDLSKMAGCAPSTGAGAGGKRRACKNCVCGLSQKEEAEARMAAAGGGSAVKLSADDKEDEAPSGGCGSCSLGDAFRCSSCPYLGKPAWKNEGDKVKLQL